MLANGVFSLGSYYLPSATLGGLVCGRGFKLPGSIPFFFLAAGFSRSSAVTHLIGTAAFATSSAGPL